MVTLAVDPPKPADASMLTEQGERFDWSRIPFLFREGVMADAKCSVGNGGGIRIGAHRFFEFYGYRRNPDDPPDNNLAGFNFWLK